MQRIVLWSMCVWPIAVPAEPVLLLSIDGLHPDYVLRAKEYGLKIPHLRGLIEEGAFARGVLGVTLTVTYPLARDRRRAPHHLSARRLGRMVAIADP